MVGGTGEVVPIIDTHCHLDDRDFDDDRQAVYQRAREAGVKTIINPGSDLEDSKAAVALAHKLPNVFATVGIHPHNTADEGLRAPLKDQIAGIDQLAKDDRVVAIGEFGIDIKHGTEQLAQQKEALRLQLELARSHKLPIVLHCRLAYKDLDQVIEEAGGSFEGEVHCFAGGPQDLKLILDRGLYVAYGGMVTFGKKTEHLLESLKQTPLDRMLLETDAPYLTPMPRRGKRNEPAEIVTIAHFIANFLDIPYAELARITTENAKKLFRLPKNADQ